MKKLFLTTVLLALVSVFSYPAMARAEVNINISLPPLIVFSSPPELIVLPDTYVYVVPSVDADIFFYDGWWWRPWEGRWYRSHYYDRDWRYYNNVPIFYFDIDPGWRGYYRDHNWYGHTWNYERIPHDRVQQNWKSWQSKRHWERQGTWGVQNYQPRPDRERRELRQQRQQQYQQRPEVQKLREPKEKAKPLQKQEQQSEGKQIKQQQKERVRQTQGQEQGTEVKQQKQQSKEKVKKQQGQEQGTEGRQQKQRSKEKAKKSEDSQPKEKQDRSDGEKQDRR